MPGHLYFVDSEMAYEFRSVHKLPEIGYYALNDQCVFYTDFDEQEAIKEQQQTIEAYFTLNSKLPYIFKGICFDISYTSGAACAYTLYTRALVQRMGSVQNQISSFYVDNIAPVMMEVLEAKYKEGELKTPGYIYMGDYIASKKPYNAWYFDILTYQRYAMDDFSSQWDKYPRTPEYLLMKFGDFEREFEVDILNALKEGEPITRRFGVLNSLDTPDAGLSRAIKFQYFTIDVKSEIMQFIATKEFWEDFIIPQITGVWEYAMEIFASAPIKAQDYLIKRFVKELTVEERRIISVKNHEVEENRKAVEELINKITRHKVLINTLNREIATRNLGLREEDGMMGKLSNQLVEIAKHEYVTDIELNDAIRITTCPILVDGVVPIGPYEISLEISSNPRITIKNVHNKQEEMDHPHVCNGVPCWGNYSDVLVHLTELDLVSTMEIVYRFLESWNPEDSWGKNLIYWDAGYAFKVLDELELMGTVGEEWDEQYYFEYGDHLRTDMCSHCGEHYDDCYCFCSYCGELIDDGCDCERCEDCGYVIDDCGCERCADCSELIHNCECELCEYCGELIHSCSCERCEECHELIHNCECEHELQEVEL